MIHCHSYRQDEMLMLMRLAEQLRLPASTRSPTSSEAYKIADEIAAARRLGDRLQRLVGLQVRGDRRDSVERLPAVGSRRERRLQLRRRRAARAGSTPRRPRPSKYGGVPREEAIKFVTLEPGEVAQDRRPGRLARGRARTRTSRSGAAARSPYSACEQTWIEGRKYFDRAADLAGREALAKERDALVAEARLAKKEAESGEARRWPPRYLDDADLLRQRLRRRSQRPVHVARPSGALAPRRQGR